MRILTSTSGAVPCLFYPVARAMDVSMRTLLTDASSQAQVLREIGKRYPVDAVVRMTELWCEAAAFGMACNFTDTDFPRLGAAMCDDTEKLADLDIPNAENDVTHPLIEAVRLAVPQLDKPLVVGVTGPYTLGSVLNGPENFMMNCMMEPETIQGFLKRVTSFLKGYIDLYKTAGAAAVMIAEPSAAMISPDMMQEFSNVYVEEIIQDLQDAHFSVIYHNCGDVDRHLSVIAELSADGFHFGSGVSLDRALRSIASDRLVMGNVDPRLFLSRTPQSAGEEASRLISEYSGYENFRLSTGCDLSPSASMDAIEAFLQAAGRR